MTVIEYKGKRYRFETKMSFDKYFNFQDNYDKKIAINSEKWWLKRTTYGEDLLIHLSKEELPEITDEDWETFHPIFAEIFPTPQEYYILLNNLRFLHGQSVGVIENSWFIKYLLMKECGELTLKVIGAMNIKDALMLYYYVINNRLVEMYGTKLFDDPDEEEEDGMII